MIPIVFAKRCELVGGLRSKYKEHTYSTLLGFWLLDSAQQERKGKGRAGIPLEVPDETKKNCQGPGGASLAPSLCVVAEAGREIRDGCAPPLCGRGGGRDRFVSTTGGGEGPQVN